MKTTNPADFTSVDFPAPRNPEMIVTGTLFSLSSKVLDVIRHSEIPTKPKTHARGIFVVIHGGDPSTGFDLEEREGLGHM